MYGIKPDFYTLRGMVLCIEKVPGFQVMGFKMQFYFYRMQFYYSRQCTLEREVSASWNGMYKTMSRKVYMQGDQMLVAHRTFIDFSLTSH
jgi:hypothetical protein